MHDGCDARVDLLIPSVSLGRADFTDVQIDSYWVDFAAEGGFQEAIQPRLDMPMLILGGKGSGKTHIMRYLSFPLQRIRHSADVVSGIAAEGYLGVYMRCMRPQCEPLSG